ncbi:MAG: hypothetical protein ABEJ99_03445 [Candidatus Nanohaloarchaea archaeon]
MSKTDMVDALFAVEFDSNNGSKLRNIQKEWVSDFPTSRINNIQEAADYVIGRGYLDWEEYMKPLRESKGRPDSSDLPLFPLSFRRPAMGMRSNCVARMTSVYILNERLDLGENIRVVVEKDQEDGNRGEHLTYYAKTPQGRNFLSTHDRSNPAEDHSVRALPSIYAIQNAIGYSSISGYCSNKRKMEEKAVRYAKRAREFNVENSSYVEVQSKRILKDASEHGVI